MIRYALKCENDHSFDSWFADADSFDALKVAGHVTCAVCGTKEVEKSLMAPRVVSRDSDTKDRAPREQVEAPLSAPLSAAEQAMAEMRKQVEENADYVGRSFAKEARDIHEGVAPERAIYGEAKPEEARKLIEDGVPVAPLPFIPKTKAN